MHISLNKHTRCIFIINTATRTIFMPPACVKTNLNLYYIAGYTTHYNIIMYVLAKYAYGCTGFKHIKT